MSFPRYPEYKESGVEWLGEVPVHWSVAPFKRMIDIQNGADHKAIEQDDGYPVIGSGGPFAYASEYMFDGESVLLGRKGTIDKPLYVTGPFWTVDTMYWTRIAEDAYGKFCYYAALTIPFDYYSTNTALPSMTKGALGAHLVAMPSLPEQRGIAQFLDAEVAKINDLVSEQEKLIALLKEKRQAVISHAVTKGLDPNVPMKDSGIEWLGEAPAHWDVMPLKHLTSIKTGFAFSSDHFIDDGVPVLRIGDITTKGTVDFENAKCLSAALAKEHTNALVQRNDIVMAMTGATLGKAARYTSDQPALLNQRVCVFRAANSDTQQFLWYVLQTSFYAEYLAVTAFGGAQPNISDKELVAISVPLPAAGEIKPIVALLDVETAKLDALAAKAERAIDLLQERRSALISAAVTGKIDVRQYKARVVA